MCRKTKINRRNERLLKAPRVLFCIRNMTIYETQLRYSFPISHPLKSNLIILHIFTWLKYHYVLTPDKAHIQFSTSRFTVHLIRHPYCLYTTSSQLFIVAYNNFMSNMQIFSNPTLHILPDCLAIHGMMWAQIL